MSEDTTTKSGMYFLANDRVLNWAIPFLESLRANSPRLPLVMIPFDERTDELRNLADKYRFDVVDDPSIAALDAIGRRFYPGHHVAAHTFRKFAVFWGPFERFIFSDTDIVFLDDVTEFERVYAASGMDLLHTDEEIVQVYMGDFRREMVEKYGARGFNTGFWSSRRGLFTPGDIEQLAEEAFPLRAGLNRGTYEQPFLNFCCDVRRIRYQHFADHLPNLTRKFLASQGGVRRDADDVYRIHNASSPEHGRRITFLHWAGTPANEVMPYRSIFLSYRLRSEPPLRRTWLRLRSVPLAAIWKTIRWIRNNQSANRLYKRVTPAGIQRPIAKLMYRK